MTKADFTNFEKTQDHGDSICVRVKCDRPPLRYLFDERIKIPLTGEALYGKSELRWEATSLAETNFSGSLLDLEAFEKTTKILPLQTADRGRAMLVTSQDISIQELMEKFKITRPFVPDHGG